MYVKIILILLISYKIDNFQKYYLKYNKHNFKYYNLC